MTLAEDFTIRGAFPRWVIHISYDPLQAEAVNHCRSRDFAHRAPDDRLRVAPGIPHIACGGARLPLVSAGTRVARCALARIVIRGLGPRSRVFPYDVGKAFERPSPPTDFCRPDSTYGHTHRAPSSSPASECATPCGASLLLRLRDGHLSRDKPRAASQRNPAAGVRSQSFLDALSDDRQRGWPHETLTCARISESTPGRQSRVKDSRLA